MFAKFTLKITTTHYVCGAVDLTACTSLNNEVKFVHGVSIVQACLFLCDCSSAVGLSECVVNVHLLIHLPYFTKKFGPLRTHSCFPFENAHGEIVSFIHGTQQVPDQVSFSLITVIVLFSS